MPHPRRLLPFFFVVALSACAMRPTSGDAAAPASPAPPSSSAPAAPAPPEPREATTTTTSGEAPHDDEAELDPSITPPDGVADIASFGPTAPPASRYGALDRAACEAELAQRKIGFDRVDTARGVIAPVRLTGPLSGVTFRSNLPASKRKSAVIEIYDCRLVLALDDFAKILAKHDVVEVVHLSVYRPVSKKVNLKGAGRRHGGALAIDAALFRTTDGRTLDVQKDFHGGIGQKTCPPPASASELRKIACEASDARLFNVLLTPDFNWAHRNHFHLEVTANARWFFVR